MQKIVENFNFEQEYRKEPGSSKKDEKMAPTSQEQPFVEGGKKGLYQSAGDLHGVISYNNRIYIEQ